MNEAAMVALEEKLTSCGASDTLWTIKTRHFERALSKISPSVSKMVRVVPNCSHLEVHRLLLSINNFTLFF